MKGPDEWESERSGSMMRGEGALYVKVGICMGSCVWLVGNRAADEKCQSWGRTEPEEAVHKAREQNSEQLEATWDVLRGKASVIGIAHNTTIWLL